MPRKKQEREIHVSNFDTKVITIRKTMPSAPKPKVIPGVSSSVKYDESTDTLTVLRFPKGFGKELRVAREKASLTQKQLAAKISRPAPLLLEIEKEGAIYDKDLITRLEKALQITFDKKYKLQ
ncbi:putative transcription factor [Nematocida sp. LUAm3]|nr:putative transcription factor [Nematocida sp. LUAm3]KAI5174104.1 putative transcription factor [Nematocida sp. LUAm2]KAI5177153.1 putative transcription factor [Nematocida sp. LUAm1]